MGADVERPRWARWIDRCGWVVVLAVGFIAYHNCFSGQFILDDLLFFPDFQNILRGPDPLLPRPQMQRWLGTWSFIAGISAFGQSLVAQHAINLAIHLFAAVALWAVVARTLRLPRFENRFADRAGGIATAVAGLWVVHPLNTAAVTYLVQRYESLMGMFVLVSTWAAIRGATALSGRMVWYGLSVLAAGAATSTKEPALVLPFVVLVYDRLFLAGSWREAVRRRWGLYLALVAVQAVILPIALAAVTPAAPAPVEEPLLLDIQGLYRNEATFVSAGFSATGVTPLSYLQTQPQVILHYLRLAVVPRPLILDYNWPVATRWWQIWPPGLVILVLLGATGWAVARGAAGGILGVWFFAFLAVSSSIVPIADLAFEHRMYLPLAAVVAAIVLVADWGLGWIAARGGLHPVVLKVAAAAAAGTALTVLTVVRNEDYRDPVGLYREMLEVVPNNCRGWNNLGTSCRRANRGPEAIEAYRMALRYPDARFPFVRRAAWLNLLSELFHGSPVDLIPALQAFIAEDPDNPSRRFLLAHARFTSRDLPGAVAEYRTAIEVANRIGFVIKEPMVFGYYAQALQDSGEPAAAVPIYSRALELDQPPPAIRNQLGQVLTRLGRYAEAEKQLVAASEQAPEVANAPYNLGVLRMHQGQPADAVNWFREALKRDGKHVWAALGLAHALHESGRKPEAARAFAAVGKAARDWPQEVVTMAWRMTTHPDPKARYAVEGLRLARLTIAAGGDRDPGALDVFAAALAEAGQFEEAERTADRAVELAKSGGHAAFAEEIKARQALYHQRKPYRQPATTAPR
jgi:tetratricopeptide (TPR) repeat protein